MSTAANTRNFVVAGHSGSGKTTLCEQILRLTGAIQRAGTVENRNTISDFMVEEQNKQSSIYASLLNCSWRDTKLFFTDGIFFLHLCIQFSMMKWTQEKEREIYDFV